jgi:long-chain fatty acid transport protein
MMMGTTAKIRLAAAMLAAVAVSSETHANSFAIRGQSAVGLGAAFAGAATPGTGLSAMFWNPAAVTQARGLWGEAHGTIVLPTIELTALPGTSPSLLALGTDADIGKAAVLPAAYAAYRLDPNWYVGLAVNAPFGLATEAGPWAGQQLALRAKIVALAANPVLGWKVNNVLSVAAGPQLLWLRGKFSRAILGTPGLPALPVDLIVEDIGLGFTAGATITPTPWTEIALGYRSQVKLDLQGHNIFTSSPVMTLIGLGAFNGTRNDLRGEVTLPDQATLGLRQRITETFTLLATAEWTNWSLLQSVPFTYTSGPAPGTIATTLNFNYRDSWFFSVGGEYQWSPQTTLRAGLGYEISPITDAVRATALPETDSWWFSAGLSYKATDRLTLDLGYTFIWYPDAPVNVGPAHADFPNLLGASLAADARLHVHSVSAALRYKWSDDSPARIVVKN